MKAVLLVLMRVLGGLLAAIFLLGCAFKVYSLVAVGLPEGNEINRFIGGVVGQALIGFVFLWYACRGRSSVGATEPMSISGAVGPPSAESRPYF